MGLPRPIGVLLLPAARFAMNASASLFNTGDFYFESERHRYCARVGSLVVAQVAWTGLQITRIYEGCTSPALTGERYGRGGAVIEMVSVVGICPVQLAVR